MDLTALLALTGLRISEGAALKWSDVDLDDASIRLADPKNREAVTLTLSDLAVSILKARQSRHEYVFPARSGKGHVTEVRGQLAILNNETGIEVTAHDLRRTFRAVAGKFGIELWRCKALMNHKQNQDVTLAHYTDLSDVRNLKPEIDRIADYFEAQHRLYSGETTAVEQRMHVIDFGKDLEDKLAPELSEQFEAGTLTPEIVARQSLGYPIFVSTKDPSMIVRRQLLCPVSDN